MESRKEKHMRKQKQLYWDLANNLPSIRRTGDVESFKAFLHCHMKEENEELSPIFYYLDETDWYDADVDNHKIWKT